MASIDKLPEGIRLTLTPGEILHLPYVATGEMFRDALRGAGWKMLNVHGKKFLKDKKFAYGDAEFINGEYVITFFYKKDILNTPPEPRPK